MLNIFIHSQRSKVIISKQRHNISLLIHPAEINCLSAHTVVDNGKKRGRENSCGGVTVTYGYNYANVHYAADCARN